MSGIEIQPGQLSVEMEDLQVVLRFGCADHYAAIRLYDELALALNAPGNLRIEMVVVDQDAPRRQP